MAEPIRMEVQVDVVGAESAMASAASDLLASTRELRDSKHNDQEAEDYFERVETLCAMVLTHASARAEIKPRPPRSFKFESEEKVPPEQVPLHLDEAKLKELEAAGHMPPVKESAGGSE